MFYCFECNKIIESESKISNYDACPTKECFGQVIDIDETILPIIILLNQKGYTTVLCCSGHFDDTKPNPFIMFRPEVNSDLLIGLPSSFHIEEVPDHNDEKCFIIRAKITSKDKAERHKQVLSYSLELLNWANNLPDLAYFACLFVRVDKNVANEIKNKLESEFNMSVLIVDGAEGISTLMPSRLIPIKDFELVKLKMNKLSEEYKCECLNCRYILLEDF